MAVVVYLQFIHVIVHGLWGRLSTRLGWHFLMVVDEIIYEGRDQKAIRSLQIT